MKRLLALSAVLTATILMGSSAQASGFGVSWGNGYNNYGGAYSHGGYGRSYSRNYGNYGSRFNNGYRSNYGSYPSFGYGRSYHDTSHYDYHPPTVQRHRGHLDYTPGHYDFHRSGHRH
ncbi:hypothetical protein [Thalassoglobus sp.]|uniref:hypothetical protein n=1 Tax=Thalassoglobus sp. TaxID=2795869 RepID=UPI003AA85E8F